MDYRPITLVHSFGKLLSKLMSLRLVPFMDRLVDRNQNAYIKEGLIHDNYKFVQRTAVLFRKRKVPKMLLKLHISKSI